MKRIAALATAIAGAAFVTAFAQQAPSEWVDMPDMRGYNYVTECKDAKCYNFNAKKMKLYSGHINYKDTDGKFKRSEWTLNPVSGGWELTKNNYGVFFPEFSNGTAIFHDKWKGKTRDITYKALTAFTVQGTLITADPSNPYFADQCIKYTNAFGAGQSLLYCIGQEGIKKLVSIDSPNLAVADAVYEWEIDFGSDSLFGRENKSRKTIAFKEKGRFVIGSDTDEGDQLTYIDTSLVWDSAGKRQEIDFDIRKQVQKTILRKTLPVAFLQSATGKVYSDSVTSYYAGAGDGVVEGGNLSNWNDSHAVTTGYDTNYTGATNNAASGQGGANYYMARAFFPIDTSGISDGAVIDSATLNFYVTAVTNTDNDGDDWISVVQTTQASTSVLANTDFEFCGAIDNPTEGTDTRPDITSLTTSAYNTITLNSTGIGWISDTGFTKLGIREGHDVQNVSIASAKNNTVTMSTSEATGTSQDPYLEVTIAANNPAQMFFPVLFGHGGI